MFLVLSRAPPPRHPVRALSALTAAAVVLGVAVGGARAGRAVVDVAARGPTAEFARAGAGGILFRGVREAAGRARRFLFALLRVTQKGRAAIVSVAGGPRRAARRRVWAQHRGLGRAARLTLASRWPRAAVDLDSSNKSCSAVHGIKKGLTLEAMKFVSRAMKTIGNRTAQKAGELEP